MKPEYEISRGRFSAFEFRVSFGFRHSSFGFLQVTRHSSLVTLIILCVCYGLGCKSPQGAASDSLASVEIRGRSALEVAHAVSEVFREASYAPAHLPANNKMMLMFEKPTGTSETVIYGGLSGKLWHRVKINIKSLDEQTHLVECDACRVLDKGDPRFEEETKLSRLNRKPYQHLLEAVNARLNP